ncbi:MAG: lipase family protein [Xanthobacteraceae bacterium]
MPATGTDVRISTVAGGMVVAFRGSVTAEDWARDFICAPVMDREDPQLGLCHAGFLDGAGSVVAAISAAVGNNRCYLTDHSLGGALALGVGALLACSGKSLDAIVTFGAPRYGMAKFVAALQPIVVRQYRRGNDPVPLVPFDVPPFLQFLDARDPLIAIGVAQRDPFACHAIAGYVVDVAKYLAARTDA